MRPLRSAALLVLAGLLSGCFQTKTLVKLNADGSGTVEETVLMNSTLATTMMMGAAGMFGENGEDATLPDGPYDEAALRARAERMGTALAGVEPVRILFGAGYTATYAFEDINDLQLYADPDQIIPSDFGEGLFGNAFEDGGWEEQEAVEIEEYEAGRDPKKAPEASGDIELDMRAPAPPPPPPADYEYDAEIIDEPGELLPDEEVSDEPYGDEPEEAPSEPVTFTYRDGRLTVHLPQPDAAEGEAGDLTMDYDDSEMDDLMGQNEIRQMGIVLGDIRFSLAVEMPGEITETTAAHASGRTLTLYDVDFGRVFEAPEGIRALMALDTMGGDPEISREGMAMLAALPGILFEAQEEVTASFATE